MTNRVCGTCRFFKPDKWVRPLEPNKGGWCEIELPPFVVLKEETLEKITTADLSCSLWKRKHESDE